MYKGETGYVGGAMHYSPIWMQGSISNLCIMNIKLCTYFSTSYLSPILFNDINLAYFSWKKSYEPWTLHTSIYFLGKTQVISGNSTLVSGHRLIVLG